MKKPLTGKKIVITRDANQSHKLAGMIVEQGGSPLFMPVIKIDEPKSWQECDAFLHRIDQFDWIVFSSANGVRFFINRAKSWGANPGSCRIAVVGKKTELVLKEFGLSADLIPQQVSARGLITAFDKIGVDGKNILIPTSDIGGEELTLGLQKLGAKPNLLPVYRTICNPEQDEDMLKRINYGEVDVILFYSPSAVACLFEILGDINRKMLERNHTVLAAIGKTTAQSLAQRGCNAQVVPEQSSDAGMVEALCAYF